jgi:hypothetical protein
MKKDAIRHGDRRRHAEELAGKTTLSKEVAFAQNAQRRFFSGFRYYGHPDFPLLYKKQSISRISLSENGTPFLKRQHFSTLADRRKKGFGIEILLSLRGIALRFQGPSNLRMLHLQLWGEEDKLS